MHQTGMRPTHGQYSGNHLLLANVALGDVLDRNPSLSRNCSRSLTHPIAQRRSKLRVVENANSLRKENVRHAARETHSRQRSGNQNTVVARQHTREMRAIAFRQRSRHPSLPLQPPSCYTTPVWFRLRRLRVGKIACIAGPAREDLTGDFAHAVKLREAGPRGQNRRRVRRQYLRWGRRFCPPYLSAASTPAAVANRGASRSAN